MADEQPTEGSGPGDQPTKGKPKRKTTGRKATGKGPSGHIRPSQKKVGDWTDALIQVLATHGNASAAIKAVGMARTTVYNRKRQDPDFAERWDDAIDEATDALEAELRRRAFEGVRKPVFYKGAICGHVQEYSDTLLIFYLKALRPEKYRDNYDIGKLIAEIQASRAPQFDRPSNPPALDAPAE